MHYFFMGSLIAHGNSKIKSGIRNSVNLFTHKSNMDWIKRNPNKRKGDRISSSCRALC